MRVFLDTNVILDALIPGRQHEEFSKRIVNIGNIDPFRFSISALSLANIAYIMRKMNTLNEVKQSINVMRNTWRVLSLDEYNIHDALRSDCPDFEDALQISIAEEDCDVIVTNNTKHFKGYTALEVCTPEEFLANISAG